MQREAAFAHGATCGMPGCPRQRGSEKATPRTTGLIAVCKVANHFQKLHRCLVKNFQLISLVLNWYVIVAFMFAYLIGVDGGGTGTRVRVADPAGTVLCQGEAGPSALGQGVEAAWAQILRAIASAFHALGKPCPDWSVCALGAGLSGVNHLPWRDQFLALNPGFARIALESDAHTALLAAHGGKPGAMVAAGTGSIGEALYADGTRRQVGGWGFPVGDEGSGAWLGLRAMAHAQAALDGRIAPGVLAQRIHRQCGTHRDDLQRWCAQAAQHEYASLARTVFECADTDPVALALVERAAQAIEQMAQALDPCGNLALAICGSVGRELQPRLSATVRSRCVSSDCDAAHGALTLIQRTLETTS